VRVAARVPTKGFGRWVAEHPRAGGPLSGVIGGVPFGLAMGYALHDWLVLPIAIVAIAVLSTWRASAMNRALAGDSNTPFEA
jgi:hypothetical protein